MSEKRSIVFVNQSSGYLMVDIINAHQPYFDHIELITGDFNIRNNPLSDHVKISRIIRPRRNSTLERLLTWSVGFFQIFAKLLFAPKNTELFIVTNPPVAAFLPIFFKNKFSVLLFDIYPDVLQENGLIKDNSLLAKVWRNANKRVLKRADKVFTITDGMKARLSRYVPATKIQVVPIWTDNAFFTPVSKQNNIFLSNLNLTQKFIVMYSGNLGYTHNVEILVDVAEALTRYEIEILIIGEGVKSSMIGKKIKEKAVKNCRLLPWQSMEMLPYSLSAADIGVVTLGSEASSLSLPSKTYNLMSVGVPLLCIAPVDSEIARLVGKHEIGKCFEKGDLPGMVAYVLDLYNNELTRQKISDNCRLASKHFTPENAQLFLTNV